MADDEDVDDFDGNSEGFEAIRISKFKTSEIASMRDVTTGANDVVDAPEDAFGFGDSSANLLQDGPSISLTEGFKSHKASSSSDGFKSHKASSSSDHNSSLRDMEITIDPQARKSVLK
jgi:hypothetical protein